MLLRLFLGFIVIILYITIFEPLFHELGHAFALVKYENYAAVYNNVMEELKKTEA